MNELDLTHLIMHHPDRGELPVGLVKAICKQESGFDEDAYRYEPNYRYLVGDSLTMNETERFGQKVSWGLMQTMGGVMREHGFMSKWFTRACSEPAIALRYGMLHLRMYQKRYGDWYDVIAAYNAGSPRKNEQGKYVNQGYVDSVVKHWRSFDTHLELKESEA